MTRIREVIEFLEEIAPLDLQEDYDNSGLIYGFPDAKITGIVFSLDLTEEVLHEAMNKGCNLVISHHPIIFRGIKKFTGHYVDRVVALAIKNDISIYAIHTNLDNVLENGVNGKIANILRLEETSVLKPKPGMELSEEIGSGVIGYLNKPMEEVVFLDYLKEKMDLKVLKHTALLNKKIEKVSICGGSGSFLLSAAKQVNADVFITADFKYHEFFEADGDIMIIDIGHYESERFTINLLYELITKNFSNFAAHCTKVNTNPIKYY